MFFLINNYIYSQNIEEQKILSKSNPVADFTFSPDNVCAETNISFTDNSTGSNLDYLWDFGDGTTSTDVNPTHKFITALGNATQTFTVSLTVTNNSGNSGNISKTVTIKQRPDILFSESANYKKCLFNITSISETAAIYNYSPGATYITSYQINWGDGSGLNTVSQPFDGTNALTHTYTAIGYYPITIIAAGPNGCNATDINDFVIESNPVATIIGPPSGTNIGCAPLTITVKDSSSNITSSTKTTINWGDGTSEVLANGANNVSLTHTYTQPTCGASGLGSYQITMKVSNYCDSSITTWSPIKVLKAPQAIFDIVNDSACINDVVSFINNSERNNCAANPMSFYTWDFGDGNTLGPTPIASAALPQQTITHQYTAIGTYNVTLTATNNSNSGCGSTSVTHQVKISQINVAFSADIVCKGEATSFTDLSTSPAGTVNGWNWNFGDGTTSNVQNPQHILSQYGNNAVSLIATSNQGCSDTFNLNVYVDSVPFAGFTANDAFANDTVFFINNSYGRGSTISSYSWDFGDGNASTNTNPFHIYTTSGTYNVKLIITDSKGCIDSIIKSVQIFGVPVVDFTNSAVCKGSPVSFTDISTSPSVSIVAWSWNFGDGTGSSTLQNPNYTYNSTGTYTVNLIITDAIGGTRTKSHTITVKNQPVALFKSDTVCFSSSTHFNDLSTTSNDSIINWSWNFGDGGTSNIKNPIYIYTQNGIFNSQLIITDNAGCKDTIVKQVTTDSLPIVSFITDTTCIGDTTHFFSFATATQGSTLTNWNWNFGDASSSTNTNPVHIYNPNVQIYTYSVSLNVTDNKGCTGTLTKNIPVSPIPIASFTTANACSGSNTAFTDNTLQPGGNISSWNWNFGDGNTSNLQNPSHTYPLAQTATSYPVSLIVVDIHGCSDTVQQNININPFPIANFTFNQACSGSNTLFADSSYSNGGTIGSWNWNFGDGTGTSTQQNPTYLYPYSTTPVNYTVFLIITDINGCKDTTNKQVTVFPLPDASFISDSICSGDSAKFINSSTSAGGQIISYSWNFGDGTGISNNQNPSYLYQQVLNSSILRTTLSVTDINGCTDTISHPVFINPIPIVDFSSDSACFGNTVTLQDNSHSNGGNITSWQWNMGDGTGNFTSPNVTYNYQTWGLFNANLTVYDVNNCHNSQNKAVLVDSLPIPLYKFTIDCIGGLTTFIDSSDNNGSLITSYYWDFGDQNYSSLHNPQHYYSQGSYIASLYITNNRGCSDSLTKTIIITPPKTVDFTYDTVCFGDTTHFIGNINTQGVPIQSILWDFGDNATSAIYSPYHIYNNQGTYSVMLTITDSMNCIITKNRFVKVNSLPNADFEANTVDFGNPTQFTDLSASSGSIITNWNWNFGDNSTSIIQNPSHQYAYPATYTVHLTVKNSNSCIDTISKAITVLPILIADFSSDTVCQGNPTHFADLSTITTGLITDWKWDFGDGNISNLPNPTHTYIASGTFTVKLNVSGNGTSDSVTYKTIVRPKPIANFSTNPLCEGENVIFNNQTVITSGTISAFLWSFGDNTTSALTSPVHIYNTNGNISVKLTATSNYGCIDTIVKSLTVYALPVVKFSPNPRIGCQPLNVEFIDSSNVQNGNIINWFWDFGDGMTSNTPKIANHVYQSNGNYTVSLKLMSNQGCYKQLIVNSMILVNKKPKAAFNYEPKDVGILNPTINFSDKSSDAMIYNWNFGNIIFSDIPSPTITFPDTGNYVVTQTITNRNGCLDSIKYTIRIKPEFKVSFANAFTPSDGNGSNDRFYPIAINIDYAYGELFIFSRWGEIIFSTNDLKAGWDGRHSGTSELLPQGVYIWNVILTDYAGQKHSFMGSVTLIR